MNAIKTKTLNIGASANCFIIAEACDNHLGNLDTAKEMCRLAKLAQADAIKFQHHLPDEEMLPNVPMSANFDIPLYEFLKKYALTIEQHKELFDYCNEIGIHYLCTPFSYKAAEEIASIGVEILKIGSGEMTDIPSILKMHRNLSLPLIISTGMSTFEEIDDTYSSLIHEGAQLALMNCVSEYPPIYEDLNLGVINKMKTRYDHAVIGHSDHSPDIYTSIAAVSLGAKIIEKHVIIDKTQNGPDKDVSITFDQLTNMVDAIRKVELGLGDEKFVHERELQIREWAFRSIVSITDIPENTIITEDMIWSKRPGTGIPARKMNEIIGKKAKFFIKNNSLIEWNMFF